VAIELSLGSLASAAREFEWFARVCDVLAACDVTVLFQSQYCIVGGARAHRSWNNRRDIGYVDRKESS
jgi:hypothetical protein